MSAPGSTADTAFRVADRLRKLPGPWDVYAERTRSYELHLQGPAIELARGPILLEGYGLRLMRDREKKTAIGFQASTDSSEGGVRAVVEDAEKVSRYSEFPAKDVELPSGGTSGAPSPEVVDAALWNDAPRTLAAYTASLIAAFEGRKGVGISFGSVKALLVEVTLANSAGLSASYAETVIALEVAIKASGGPEGAAPGEYWMTSFGRRLEPDRLPQEADDWARFAQDARRAKSPPNGELTVVLPPSVLEGILPASLGMKLSGSGELRKLSPAPASQVAPPGIDLYDDGTIAWGTGSAPLDDEGTPQRRRTLIAQGKISELLYDSVYGNALGHASTGSGIRVDAFGGAGWRRFTRSPEPHTATMVVPPGDGGTDAELAEQAGEGIWVQQLGWASPDPFTTAFGGEIRIGYRIRHGKIAEPIRGGTLGGLVLGPQGAPSLLANLSSVGSRPELSGRVYVPPLLVRGLTVSSDERPAATAAP
ncbi:MAG: TldD/PmbA family protein [Thermoplasmata archaeon]